MVDTSLHQERREQKIHVVYYLIGWALVSFAAFTLSRVPLPLIYRLANILGHIYFTLATGSRKKISGNMQFAFQEEKDPREIEHLTRESMVNFFRNYLELFFFTGPHRDQLLNQITIEGREYLDFILSRGRGLIAVSAHLNNFALMILKLSHEGYPVAIAVKDLKGAAQSRIYARCRKDLLNLNSILTQPSSRFSREVMKLLKGNGIICLIADENKRHGGVFVDFFGYPASTAAGPAYLTLKTGTPVVPVFMVRRRDNRQKIVIEPPLNYELSGNNEKDIEILTSQFTRTIESYVRKYPGQWRWDHFRWKTQPSKERDMKKPSQLSLFNGRIP